MLMIRRVSETDLPTLADLYRQTVLVHAPQFYTPAQTTAWASFASDTKHFQHFIFSVTTWVAVDNTGILGFAGIGENGHVSSVYVRHDSIHRGIGSRLMEVVLEFAKHRDMTRLYAEASHFSLGLFTKFGFTWYDTEIVDRNGVQFERYRVERQG